MTYEQGKAPKDAPATWTFAPHSTARTIIRTTDLLFIDSHKSDADAICRAFHKAKMADEMRAKMTGAPLCPPGT